MSRKPPKRKAKRDNSPAARQARAAVAKIRKAIGDRADVHITVNKDHSLRVHHVKEKTDDKDAIPQPAQDAGGRSS